MQEIPVGFCPDVRALRVNFVGSLGWELHHPIEYQAHLFDALMAAGRAFAIALVGMRALDSIRREQRDRKRAVKGTGVYDRVDLEGGPYFQKKNKQRA